MADNTPAVFTYIVLDTAGNPEPTVNIGNYDGWVKVTTDGKIETYELHALFVFRDVGIVAPQTQQARIKAATRLEAETKAKELAHLLNCQPGSVQLVGGAAAYVGPQEATTGTLFNPFSELSVSDLYCISVEHEDTGGRFYEVTITFQRPRPRADGDDSFSVAFQKVERNGTTTIGDPLDVGLAGSIMSISGDALTRSYRVITRFTARTRREVEVYKETLLTQLAPRAPIPINTLTGQAFDFSQNAVVGNLIRSYNAGDADLEFEYCSCTEVNFSDDGGLTIGVDVLFQRPTVKPVVNANSDDRVAKVTHPDLGVVVIGNGDAVLQLDAGFSFQDFSLRTIYRGVDAYKYSLILANALGYTPIIKVDYPRASISGTLGGVKSYHAKPVTLVIPALSVNETGLYIENISVNPITDNVVEVVMAFTKSR